MEEENNNTSQINPQETVTKKDPKRVEQGKRLAAISKQAKEDKMRRKIKEEDFSYLPNIIYPLAFLSSAGFIYLLLFGKSEKEDIHPMTIIKETSPIKEVKKKSKFENFN